MQGSFAVPKTLFSQTLLAHGPPAAVSARSGPGILPGAVFFVSSLSGRLAQIPKSTLPIAVFRDRRLFVPTIWNSIVCPDA
jgi:hypothetical protein